MDFTSLLHKWRGGQKAPIPEARGSERPRYAPLFRDIEQRAASRRLGMDAGGYGAILEPPGHSLECSHAFYRFLRDRIPDVAAGIWAWVRLCSTERRVEYIGGTERERGEAQRLIQSLEERLLESSFDHRPGLDGILEQFFQSVFTVGAYAGEIAAFEGRRGIRVFQPVNPATIRFRQYPSSGKMRPVQMQEDGGAKPLSEASFFYYGLDTEPGNPYGRSPLSSLPCVLRLQQQLFEDMGKAAHNAGYPSLHVRYRPTEREPGEPLSDYQERIQADFEAIDGSMRTRSPESNFLTQDNVEIKYIGPSGQMLAWRETLETISEQVVAALHLAPFLIGRNYGTTQSWARAQYDLMVNNAASVQRAAARLADWISNLELALQGSPVRTRCRFAPHNSWNDIDDARAQQTRLQTLLTMKSNGLISQDQVILKLQECQ